MMQMLGRLGWVGIMWSDGTQIRRGEKPGRAEQAGRRAGSACDREPHRPPWRSTKHQAALHAREEEEANTCVPPRPALPLAGAAARSSGESL